MSHDHTAPAGSLPVLDLDGASDFLELTRAEIMVLVPQAMIEIREKFGQIRQGVTANELPDVARFAHTIKSVAASIGAETVRESAQTLEVQARSGTPDDCLALTATLEQAIGQLNEAVAALPA